VTEFTGERVIPGQVNDDLWAEHIARYEFAARFVPGKNVLDVGCGTGYGSALLAETASSVIALDTAPDALSYAIQHFRHPSTSHVQASYVQGSATAPPFRDHSFEIITAFEVIEHLSEWRDFLKQARRVLTATGVLLVSTPNKLYYAESRAHNGPNPYHVHEFEYAEFRQALSEFFPSVQVLLQDRLEAFAFYSPGARGSQSARFAAVDNAPEQANFFLAVCAIDQPPPSCDFLYVPRAANLLRERELHIDLVTEQLNRIIADHHQLQTSHEEQTAHLESHNRWALELEQTLRQAQQRIADLQTELDRVQTGYSLQVAELEDENRKKTEWALRIERELAETEQRLTANLMAQTRELATAVRLLDQAENTVVERTLWAQGLDQQVAALNASMQSLRQTRWMKLGRGLGLGPK